MTIKKRDLFFYLAAVIIFLLSFIPYLNIILTVIVLISIVFYMKNFIYKYYLIWVSLSYLIFNHIVLISGNLFLEFYFAEFFKENNAMFTGSTLRLIVYIYFLYKGFINKFRNTLISKQLFNILNERKSKLIYFCLLITILVCQLISINVLLQNGIAMGDRVGYERQYMDTIEVSAKWILIKISFFIGVLYTINRKKGLIVLNFISLIILLMFGIKFGEIFLNLSNLILPISLKYIAQNNLLLSKAKIKKGLITFVIFLLFAFINVSFIYSKVYDITLLEGYNKTFSRIASQSLLYHFIDSDLNIVSNNISELSNEITVISKVTFDLKEYLEEGNEPIGLFKLNKVYDAYSYEVNIEKGYNLSGGFPGIVVYYFGFIVALFIVYYMGNFLAYIYNNLLLFCITNSFIGMFIAYQLLDYVLSVFILGNLYYLFRVSFLIKLFALIIYKFYIGYTNEQYQRGRD